MAVNLVIARCGEQAALAGDLDALPQDARDQLLDRTPDVALASFVRSVEGRTAVGRRQGGRATWWVVDERFPLQPPHALLLEPGLFTPDGDGSVPQGVVIEELWQRITRGEDPAAWVERIAALVRVVRGGGLPASLEADAPHEALESAAVLVALLVDRPVSVSIGHPHPDPAQTGLCLGAVTPGFPPIAELGPGDDPVASFVHSRLRSEPELLQVDGGLTEAIVQELLDDEELDEEDTLVNAGLIQRVIRGAPVDEALADELAEATVNSGDPSPWSALAHRPEIERRRAATALLRRSGEVEPSRALVESFLRVVPRGYRLAPICAALLEWMRRSERPAILATHLEAALTEWPQEAGRANRASLWTEAVRILVQRGFHREAAEAVTGPVTRQLIAEGSSTSVALMWTTLPEEHQDPADLLQLVADMARDTGGDRGAALLLRRLQPGASQAFCSTWAENRDTPPTAHDEVLEVALAGPHLGAWLRAMVAVHPPNSLVNILAGVLDDPDDARWQTVFQELARGRSADDALVLAGGLPADSALEPVARELLARALGEIRFPHTVLAEISARYAEIDDTLLWAWIGVSAAHPGDHPDGIIDGTVVALCDTPPPSSADRITCHRAARQLGAANEWTPLDHARWIVRLALAPQESGLAEELLADLLVGLVNRFDAAPHLAGVVRELMQLGPDHPALSGLLLRWLPDAWRARMPAAFVEAVRVRGIPADVMPLWNSLLHAED